MPEVHDAKTLRFLMAFPVHTRAAEMNSTATLWTACGNSPSRSERGSSQDEFSHVKPFGVGAVRRNGSFKDATTTRGFPNIIVSEQRSASACWPSRPQCVLHYQHTPLLTLLRERKASFLWPMLSRGNIPHLPPIFPDS